MFTPEFLLDYPIMLSALAVFLVSYFTKWRGGLVLSLALAAISYFTWRFNNTLLPMSFDNWDSIWMGIVYWVEISAFAAGFLYIFAQLKKSDRIAEADAYEKALHESGVYPSVDVFIPTYNEPENVVKKTIANAMTMDYPNFTVYVLDDGKREWLKNFCSIKGVNYVTREDNSHAKAGNMNNALKQATGDLVAIFDADFCAFPEFLSRTVGFFKDEKIGILQTPHHFYNNDPLEYNSGMLSDVGDEQRLWFDDILPARDNFNVATSCGSSSVVRRSALDEIGGFPVDTITEDYDTSIRFLEKGLITRYLNERLSVGLAAENLEGFFSQRRRWARGNIQVWKLHFKRGNFFNPLTYLMLFDWYYVVQIPARLFNASIPLFFLYFGMVPLVVGNLSELALMHWAFLALFFVVLNTFSTNKYIPFVTNAIGFVCAFKIFWTVVKSYIKPFGEPFQVTPKGVNVTKASTESKLLEWTLTISSILLVGGSVYAIMNFDDPTQQTAVSVAVYWAIITAISLWMGRKLVREQQRYRKEERFFYEYDVELFNTETGLYKPYKTKNISLGGFRIDGGAGIYYNKIKFPSGIVLPIVKIKHGDPTDFSSYTFDQLTDAEEHALTSLIINKQVVPVRSSSLRALKVALRRLFV